MADRSGRYPKNMFRTFLHVVARFFRRTTCKNVPLSATTCDDVQLRATSSRNVRRRALQLKTSRKSKKKERRHIHTQRLAQKPFTCTDLLAMANDAPGIFHSGERRAGCCAVAILVPTIGFDRGCWTSKHEQHRPTCTRFPRPWQRNHSCLHHTTL